MADNHSEREREDTWRQLQNAISMRSSEHQVLWTIFGAHSAANAVLLVAIFQGGHFPNPTVGTIISLFGIMISASWLWIQLRSLGHKESYEALIKRLDAELTKDRETHSLYYDEGLGVGLKLKLPAGRQVMVGYVALLLTSWIVLFLYFLLG